MAVDYDKLALTAQRLIQENGRAITLKRNDRTTADPAKPWNGPTTVEAPTSDLSLYGVFVPPNTVRQFGLTALGQGTELIDLLKFREQIIITSQGQVDIRNYDRVVDSGYPNENWSLTGMQVLRPGNTYILAFIGVRR